MECSGSHGPAGDGADVMKKPSSGVLKYTQYRPAWWRMAPAHTPRP
jgi:hypothetical protein